jgi:uncharacterized protein (TIGR03437 family)
VNTSFVDGQVALGFGSSDVIVRRLWVTSANHIYANVSVNAAAASLSTEVSVVSGLQLVSQPFGLQILPANARQVSIIPPILNSATGAAGVPAGGVGILNLSNLTAPAGAIGLSIGGLRASVLSTSGNQVTFQVPASLPLGPAVVVVQLPTGDVIAPVVMDIEPAAPVITAAFSSPGVLADAAHPAARGGVVLLSISGLPDPAGIADISTIHVNVGGIDHNAVSASSQNGAVLVQIMLNNNVSAGLQVPATVSFNGATSQPFLVAIR